MAEERLQKILSRAGIASRRAAEKLILEGRVQVNGVVVRELGTKADPSNDLIRVDDQVIAEPESFVYLVLYKPPSMVTTLSDPEGRPSVGELLRKAKLRVFPVGRLDYDAEGALLLTNDGELAHKLTHPRWGCRRTYEVKVKGEMQEGALERLRQGVRLEDGMALPLEVAFLRRTQKNTWIRMVLTEGRHHLVKRLCDAVGHPVVRLFRSDYAGIGVVGMRPGDLRPLAPREVQGLRAAVAQQAPLPPGGIRKRRRPGGGGAVSNPVLGQTRRAPERGSFDRGGTPSFGRDASPGLRQSGPRRGGAGERLPMERVRSGPAPRSGAKEAPLGRQAPRGAGTPRAWGGAGESRGERSAPAERRGPSERRGPAERRASPEQRAPSERRGPTERRAPAERRGPPERRAPAKRSAPAGGGSFSSRRPPSKGPAGQGRSAAAKRPGGPRKPGPRSR